MQRLTKRGSDGVIRMVSTRYKPNFYLEPYELTAHDVQILLERLATYEATDMEPQAITTMKQSFLGQIAAEIADTEGMVEISRAKEIAIAESEERLAIAPCKVGDTVWAIRHNPWEGKIIKDFTVSAISIHMVGLRTEIIIHTTKDDIYGKTVFLTKEEAETSLQKEKS